MGKRLQKCSTSTDVDSTTQNEKESESESYDLEQVVLKKHKKPEYFLFLTPKHTRRKNIIAFLGFALLNILPDEKKALALDGSYLGNLKLEVGYARSLMGMGMGSRKYPNFIGCERCVRVQRTRKYERFIETRGGLIQRRTALLDSMFAEAEAGRKRNYARQYGC